MHEQQRPPSSPAAHPIGQPQRVIPAQPAAHAPHAAHQHLHPQHAPHGAHAPQALQPGARPAARPGPSTASLPVDDDLVVLDDAITLEDDGEVSAPAAAAPGAPAARSGDSAAPAPKKITFNADAMGRQRTWKRKPHLGGQGACRVKTFHGKCSDQGLEYLDDAINFFLDEHPEIEVKFVQSNVAMFDGKFKDFALIVNVWY